MHIENKHILWFALYLIAKSYKNLDLANFITHGSGVIIC